MKKNNSRLNTKVRGMVAALVMCLVLAPVSVVCAEDEGPVMYGENQSDEFGQESASGGSESIHTDITPNEEHDVGGDVNEDPNKDKDVSGDVDPDKDTKYDNVTISAEINPVRNFDKGTGTKDDPYIVETAGNLVYMSKQTRAGNNYKGKYIKLGQNINLGQFCGENTGDWQSIGIYEGEDYDTTSFDGNFDGEGHTISGLYIKNGGDAAGLFGELETNGTIKNLTVKGEVHGGKYVGGIVGYSANGASVLNCSFEGEVYGSREAVGGVVGCSGRGLIEGCSSKGYVSGLRLVGGVIGHNYKGVIRNCEFKEGTVSGSSYNVGGIIGNSNAKSLSTCISRGHVCSDSMAAGGIAGGSATPISDCNNYAEVIAKNCYGGGIVGNAFGCHGDYGTVTRCNNYGKIQALKTAGGIVGYAAYDVSFCQNYGEVSAERGRIGGIAGVKDDDVKMIACFDNTGKYALVGSAFGGGSIVMILVLSGVAILILIVAAFFVRKRKKAVS